MEVSRRSTPVQSCAALHLSRLYSEEKTLFDRINRIDRMNAQILFKERQSLFR
jgi:hypothetical protein